MSYGHEEDGSGKPLLPHLIINIHISILCHLGKEKKVHLYVFQVDGARPMRKNEL